MEKNKLWMIIIIAILAIMLVAVGVGFAYTIKLINKPPVAESEIVDNTVDVVNYSESHVIPIPDDIKANLLQDADGSKHLALVNVSVVVRGVDHEADKKTQKKETAEIEKLVADITARDVIVRNAVIKLIKKRTLADMERPDAQQVFTNDLVAMLQDLFATNYVVDIAFGEFYAN